MEKRPKQDYSTGPCWEQVIFLVQLAALTPVKEKLASNSRKKSWKLSVLLVLKHLQAARRERLYRFLKHFDVVGPWFEHVAAHISELVLDDSEKTFYIVDKSQERNSITI